MNYQQLINWLHALPRISKAPGLTGVRALLNKLNNPQSGLKFVHLAGTNGKGSATVMLASILKQAGYKTGANISPYVIDFRERFQINGEMISQNALAEILTDVKAAYEALYQSINLCEFDVVTAAALLWFSREKCDIVCIEVGIGGRFDATNAIDNTLVACIMHIAMDHTEMLGDTLAKIAAEKCAIFKNKCEVVSYPLQSEDAMAVIKAEAAKNKCSLTVPELQDFYFYKAQPFENRINYGGYDLCVPFSGRHQALNASVALEAALRLCEQGFDISDDAIINGIENAQNPARIEIVSKKPLIIIDGSHNPDGAQALCDTIRQAGCKKMAAVIGVLRDKEPLQMLKSFAKVFDKIYAVTPQSPRALSSNELAQLADGLFAEVQACESVQQAIEKAKRHENGMCVCGSLFLACEAREILVEE